MLDNVFQYTRSGSPLKVEGSIVPNRGIYQLLFVNSGWELDDVIIQQVNELYINNARGNGSTQGWIGIVCSAAPGRPVPR